MVNIISEPNPRDLEIIAILRQARLPVSGQKLADRLGISRVALWKRIDHLKTCAYGITATRRGYFLQADDVVTPWEFPDGLPIIYRREIGSTMDEAWRLAEAGALSGTMVITDHQTKGRGRRDHQWHSPAGGIYLSLILRPALPASHAASLVLQAAATMVEWLAATHGCSLQIDWPNDLMAQGSKVGGILAELAGAPDSPRFYILGLGINLHPAGLPDRPSAGLAELTDHAPLRRDLAVAFRDRLLAWSQQPAFDPEFWERYCPMINQTVLLTDWLGQATHGRVRGLDQHGAIRITETGSGFDKSFLPGETISIRPQNQSPGVQV